MARAEIGNEIGVAAVDSVNETLLGTVVSDGANNFVVSAAEIKNFRVGQVIDVVTKATGVVGAGVTARTVTAVDNVANTVTYSGADATLTSSFAAYPTGQWELASPVAGTGGTVNDPYANLNGGNSPFSGFGDYNTPLGNIQAMRDRLKIISATTYSDAEMDKMTYNDLVYAIRVNDYAGSIK